ncbi:MAG: sigma-70 family RNA polymerase sigma factor [Planctomycetes bacterium]|nr:sigma-70 family RNA polymerase sigma factor [Planctomycetota bacterium]
MSQLTPSAADTHTIAAWCHAAAGGSTGALEKLLWTYHGRLLSFTRRKVGVDWQGKIDPEDLLQEAYIAVFAGIGEFEYRDEDSFYHWAARIVEHRFIDHVRRWRRKKRAVSREASAGRRSSSVASLLERVQQHDATASQVLRRADAAAALLTCVARLPDDYRAVVQRFYLRQEPLADIAADLGRSEDAVRRLGSRALERLARCLGRASRYLSTHAH